VTTKSNGVDLHSFSERTAIVLSVINVRIIWCEPKKGNTGMGKPLVENKLAEVVVIGEKYPVFLICHCKNIPVSISSAGGFLVNTELRKKT
jgi:hypothetical protein